MLKINFFHIFTQSNRSRIISSLKNTKPVSGCFFRPVPPRERPRSRVRHLARLHRAGRVLAQGHQPGLHAKGHRHTAEKPTLVSSEEKNHLESDAK